jgi:RNase P subunit RPR2
MDQTVVFKCPRTGMNVQHRLPDMAADAPPAGDSHVTVTCLACGSIHFVNTATGKLLGDGDRDGGQPGQIRRPT